MSVQPFTALRAPNNMSEPLRPGYSYIFETAQGRFVGHFRAIELTNGQPAAIFEHVFAGMDAPRIPVLSLYAAEIRGIWYDPGNDQ